MTNQTRRPFSSVAVVAVVVLLSSIAFLAVWLASRARSRPHDGRRAGAGLAIHPHAKWSPEEVVRHQLAALRESGNGEEGIRQCYQFASPFNRAATGPLARFERMVRSPPYDVMLRAAETLVGSAVVQEGRAAVLVTIVDPQRTIHVFRFFLSKQQQPPYEDCWMTDAVGTEGSLGTSSASAVPPTEGKTDV